MPSLGETAAEIDRLGEAVQRLKIAAEDARAAGDPDKAERLTTSARGLSNEQAKLNLGYEKQKQAADDYNKALGTITGTSRAAITSIVGMAAATVKFGNPAAFQTFTLALRDLAGVVGQILTPVLDMVSGYVRQLADWLINLSDSTKSTIGSALQAALRIAGVALAMGTLARVIMIARAALLALTTASGPIGAILGILAMILASNEEALKPIIAAFGQLFSAIGPLVEALGAALAPALIAIGKAVAAVVTAIATLDEALLDALTPVLIATAEAIAAVVTVIADAVSTLMSLVGISGKSKKEPGVAGGLAGVAPRDSMGAGGRDSSLISIEESSRQLLLAGTKTRAEDYAKKTAENTQGILEEVKKKGGSSGGSSLGTIAGQLLGGISGFIIGGPAGAQVGATVGGDLGGRL